MIKKIQKVLIVITQLFILVTIRLIYLGRVKTYSNDDIRNLKGPILIAANHADEMDPFIISCFLPLRTIFRIFPYVYMTANIFYYGWWKPLAFLAGCYPAKARRDDEPKTQHGVGRSVDSLNNGYSVVMFPEGKRTRKPIEAKPGVSYILQSTGVKFLLIHVDCHHRSFWKHFEFSVKVAEDELDRNDPMAIMKAVYDLPFKRDVAVKVKSA